MSYNKGISTTIIFMITLFLLSGCSTSTIQYQHIQGTSEEFSQDVYIVLNEFANDIKKDNRKEFQIMSLSDSVGGKFIDKYKKTILNQREQEIYKLISDKIDDVDIYLLVTANDKKYTKEKHINLLKDGAEAILHEIQN